MEILPNSTVVARPYEREWLKNVERFIEGHLDDPGMNIADVAGAVYTSERQFFRRIKKLTGHTPNILIRRKRLEKAKKLLMEKNDSSLKDVARKVGFSRTDYFSALFTRAYGVHPASLIRDGSNIMARPMTDRIGQN